MMSKQRSAGVAATRTYTIILEPAEEGGFVVHVPALPEVVTEGDTEAEAVAMAKDAIELVLASRRERGEPIQSSPHQRLASWLGWPSASGAPRTTLDARPG